MRMQISFNPRQLAEKWVSATVLLGCVLITVGLVYLTYTASVLGSGWTENQTESFQENGF